MEVYSLHGQVHGGGGMLGRAKPYEAWRGFIPEVWVASASDLPELRGRNDELVNFFAALSQKVRDGWWSLWYMCCDLAHKGEDSPLVKLNDRAWVALSLTGRVCNRVSALRGKGWENYFIKPEFATGSLHFVSDTRAALGF